MAISESGDHVFLSQAELETLVATPDRLPLELLATLKSRFFVGERNAVGMRRLLASRIAAKKETVAGGPSLHIIVPTLQCGHSCRYCQVSRALNDTGFSMSVEQIEKACDSIFESPSQTLTVEFQGGDPLIRFDLVRYAIERISRRNQAENRSIRFVIATTLHQLTEETLLVLSAYPVVFSTSIDGPAALHNKNRPIPSRDAYERTMSGIALVRRHLGSDAVSALMTATKDSLLQPEAIVDEYVRLGFNEIFLRPLSFYGFAKRNEQALTYSSKAFQEFYQRAFERILHWNRQGVAIREVSAAIVFNKILSPFDAGYVDLQSPTGAASAVLVYNYDGWVYPSDEARMLAETGDTSLRLGKIGESLDSLLAHPVTQSLIRHSTVHQIPECSECAFNHYCGPDPVGMHSQFGRMDGPVHASEHCKRYLWLFEFLFKRLRDEDTWFEDLAYSWALPPTGTLEVAA